MTFGTSVLARQRATLRKILPWGKRLRSTLSTLILVACFFASMPLASAREAAGTRDAQALKEQLIREYPSLLYVDHYRAAYPDEIQGTRPIWSEGSAPAVPDSQSLVEALAQLQDQHVALVGAKAGKTETLGVLFRSSADGSLIAWRDFDPATTKGALKRGDRVLAIGGVKSQAWLQQVAKLTFGGNRRGRMAEAALDLGLATPIVHKTSGLGAQVELLVHSRGKSPRMVKLAYRPMNEQLAIAMSAAIEQPDLPERFQVGGLRVGALRIGAFAPQYDPVFVKASDAAGATPGTSDDEAMLAGYCAVVHGFTKRFDSLAQNVDVMVLDLRGNMGGFDREARLFADALAGAKLPRTFDFAATSTRGTVELVEEKIDPSCGRVAVRRPVVVVVDAGTRSAGEFMTSWLWAAGFPVIGETTMGAGGGYQFEGPSSFALPESGFNVRASAVFSIFDPVRALTPGRRLEAPLVELITAQNFKPSRARPFAIQSVGFIPDLQVDSRARDLQDGGLAQLKAAIAKMMKQGRLRQD